MCRRKEEKIVEIKRTSMKMEVKIWLYVKGLLWPPNAPFSTSLSPYPDFFFL